MATKAGTKKIEVGEVVVVGGVVGVVGVVVVVLGSSSR